MEVSTKDVILVTGASGFFGMNVLQVLNKRYANSKIVAVNSKEYDLRNELDCSKMFDKIKPTLVIHLAGKVGGILANKKYPVEFYNDNILINTLVFKHAYENKVKKLVTAMGGCSYPANASSPISEDQMWNGYPQEESAAYSIAKKMVLVQSKAYRKEYGFNSVVMIPGNMYGEYDNFTLEGSHVIPAMIRKMYDAVHNGSNEVTFFGTGKPQRDFVYVKDVAACVPFFIEEYESSEPINISSGNTTEIKNLISVISEKIGFKGQIEWDLSKPDGQMVKIFSVERMRKLSISCDTPLEVGIENTINWFLKNIRLNQVRI